MGWRSRETAQRYFHAISEAEAHEAVQEQFVDRLLQHARDLHRRSNKWTPYQLELTLELLRQEDWPDFGEPEVLPPNVIRFRPRVCR